MWAPLLLLALRFSSVSSICDDFDTSKLEASDEKDYCKAQIKSGSPPKVGDVCLAHPEDLSPTQASFGEVDAACVQQSLENYSAKKDGSLKDYLISHPAPTVLGPGGRLFLTDHHHLSHALLRAFLPYKNPKEHRAMYVCVTDDFSKMDNSSFWESMVAKQLVWLKDEQGRNISAEQLPTSVKYLRDDPYRTLAEYARNSFAFVKCGKKSVDKLFPQCNNGAVVAQPFIEFRWAQLYRAKFTADDIYIESDQGQVDALKGMLQDVVSFSLSEENKNVEGWNVKQYTELVSLDHRGCEADSAASSMLLV